MPATPNDSSTGGFVQPYSPPAVPLNDDTFDALMQGMVAGISGLPGDMVRPRWQPVPPKMPEATVDWCAIGVLDQAPEYGPYIQHWPGEPGNQYDRTKQGFDEYLNVVKMEIMATFYGPNASAYANIFRDGLSVGQNRDTLFANGMQLVSSDSVMSK